LLSDKIEAKAYEDDKSCILPKAKGKACSTLFRIWFDQPSNGTRRKVAE